MGGIYVLEGNMLVLYLALERPLTERQLEQVVEFLGDKDVSWYELGASLRRTFYKGFFEVTLYDQSGAERAGKLAEAFEVLVLFQGDGGEEWLKQIFENAGGVMSISSFEEIFQQGHGYRLPLFAATRERLGEMLPQLAYKPQREIVFTL